MFTKDIDVLIYFEHISRELDACFILKYQLELLDISCEILPVHRNRYKNIIKFKPKLIIVPFLFVDKKDRLLTDFIDIYGDVICLNLHHEQFYNDMTKSHFMPKNELSKNAYHLAWTESFAKDLIENGVDKDKILIIGNPRTDIFYLKAKPEILEYKKNSEKLIFVPTSFSWAFVDEDYFLKNAKLDRAEFIKQKEITVKTAEIYFKTIRKTARQNKNTFFILRPHPFEDINKYIEKIKTVFDGAIESNIKITRDGNIYDWLGIADLVIGWLTTVSMEATLFNIKNVVFQPVELDSKMQIKYIEKYDQIVSSEKELVSILGNVDNYNPQNLRLKEYIHNEFGKVDGNINKMIASNIKLILKKNVLKQKRTNKFYSLLFKSIKVDFVKNIFIRFGILPKYNNMYAGLMEDLLTNKEIKKRYIAFKKRL